VFGSHEGSDLSKATRPMTFLCERVGFVGSWRALGFGSELFEENAIFLLEVRDDACWCRFVQPATAMRKNWN